MSWRIMMYIVSIERKKQISILVYENYFHHFNQALWNCSHYYRETRNGAGQSRQVHPSSHPMRSSSCLRLVVPHLSSYSLHRVVLL
jgi:hypothetical protein